MFRATGGNRFIDADVILHKARVGANMKTADFGCGSSGKFVIPMARAVGPKGRVYAIDILRTSLDCINQIKKHEHLENIKTVWSNLEVFNGTKIPSGSLNAVLLANTLYLSHKRAEIIREAARTLKKGGRLVVIDWRNISLPFGPPADERVDIDAVIAAAKNFSLHLDEEFFAGPYHFGLLFTKI